MGFYELQIKELGMFLRMIKFGYNNTKNTSTSHTFFQFNYGYYFCISYKKNLDFYTKLKIMKKLSFKLQNLIAIC